MPLQLSPPTSTIRIVYDGTDIQDYCLYSQCSFECQANAIPGTARIVVKDEDRTLSFTTGKELYLYVDDVKMWGGLVMRVGRQYAFPVDDTTNLSSVKTRQWVLECSDFNIWFDKLVIRNPANYTKAIVTDGIHMDGHLIRNLLPNYIDVPPGLNISKPYVMNIQPFGARGNEEGVFKTRYAWVTQGTPWRKQMDEFAARSAAMYYIDPDKNLVFQNMDRSKVDWSFVDYQPQLNLTVPIREVSAQEDGSAIVNDALVWGGLEAEEAIYFSRYPDPPANTETFTLEGNSNPDPGEDVTPDITVTLTAEKEQEAIQAQTTFGRWQLGEQRFQEGNTLNTTKLRAFYLVNGPPGADPFGTSTGLRYPLWRFTLSWFAHDVPRIGGVPQHIRPGNLVNIYLYVMGEDPAHPLIQFLPLRNMSISFPQLKTAGEAWVKFTGEFAISYGDSRYLWAYLLARGTKTTKQIISSVNNFSSSSNFGDFADLSPNEAPDGTRTVFTFPFPLVPQTMEVYVNGLRWRKDHEYRITGQSEITLSSPLYADDQIRVKARTTSG